MKIKFKPHVLELRQYCIDYDYYTCGDNRAYAAMFDKFETARSASGLEELLKILDTVAADIMDHSDPDNWIFYNEYKETKREIISDILNAGMITYIIE